MSGLDLTVRSLVERAAENSVKTQSLIAGRPGSCSPSQACMRLVSGAFVSAATSSDVSR
jgi:hypothetical protein